MSKAHETRDSLSSSCSQAVLVYLRAFRRNSLFMCASQQNRKKKNTKTLNLENSRLFKVIDIVTN